MISITAIEQYVAIVLLSLVFIGCLIVCGYDLITNQQIPALVQDCLSIGIGACVHALGISTGLVLEKKTS